MRDFLPAGGTIKLQRGEGIGYVDDETGTVAEDWSAEPPPLPPYEPPSEEALAEGDAREAAAYGELLETLKELVDQEAKGPPTTPPAAARGGAAAEAPWTRRCALRRGADALDAAADGVAAAQRAPPRRTSSRRA